MVNRVYLSFVVTDLIFLASAGLLAGIAAVQLGQLSVKETNADTVAKDLLIDVPELQGEITAPTIRASRPFSNGSRLNQT
jgi:hypothetical protein